MASNTNSAATAKRRRPNISYDKIRDLVDSVGEETDYEVLKTLFMKLQELLDEAEGSTSPKRPKLESTPASAIKNLGVAVRLFGLEWGKNSENYIWPAPNTADVVVGECLDSMLAKMLEAPFWNTESSEALCRSTIDFVLFNRLAAHQEEVAARQLSLHGEYAVVAHCRQLNKVVSGNADYALGYEPQQLPETRPQLESSVIIVEAKKKITFDTGIAQAVTYMVGIKQHRENLKRIVHTVYGMVSDGVDWQFLRLDGCRLMISLRVSSITSEGRHQIYQFVDAIVRAAISSSPHTTPQKHFQATERQWQERVEAEIFGTRIPWRLRECLKIPAKDYLVYDDEDAEDLAGTDELEVV